MTHAAIMWIRDGVLIDRMHVNPVAFALASLSFAPPAMRTADKLVELINFGFAKSGYSGAEKMCQYNDECQALVDDVESATRMYNDIATAAGRSCHYFPGMVDLLEALAVLGVRSFITSAVEQEVLDAWSETTQGAMVAPYLQEILGKRQNFVKGIDHFKYVRQQIGDGPIYYVADAVSEITSGKQFSSEFGITSVGFGHVVTKENVLEAYGILCDALNSVSRVNASVVGLKIDPDSLRLPDRDQIHRSLTEAGASHVVSGAHLVPQLHEYFEREGIVCS